MHYLVIGNDKKTLFYSYGTTNQAFDPHAELDDISHGSFQVRKIFKMSTIGKLLLELWVTTFLPD